MSRIPKVIHYCWFGNNPKPEIVNKCINTWKAKMPDYTIKEWNEDNFKIEDFKFAIDAYEKKKWAFVADYCRLWVLYNYGGIYLDTDMEILHDLTPFTYNEAFTGVEDGENIAFGIWGCKPGDQFIKEILDYYDTIEFNNYTDDLFEIAIPKVITKLAKDKGYKPPKSGGKIVFNSLTVYSHEVFYPKRSSWEKAVITENTFTIHHYEGSWKTPTQILRTRTKKKIINIARKLMGKEAV